MDRRAFLGIGALALIGLAIGCGKRSEGPRGTGTAPTATVPPPVPSSGPTASKMTEVACPKCGAKNKVVYGSDGKPQEITCWKCGHKWTPQV